MSAQMCRAPGLLARSSGLYTGSLRTLTTSSCLCGRKTREPFDRRFPISPKDVSEHKKWGDKEIRQLLGRKGHMVPQEPGYLNAEGKFVFVPEMVPEFVVPDLTDFNLKPYVSYKVTDIKQSEFTAKDLFDALYSKKIIEDFKAGKLDETDPVNKYTKES